MEGLPRELVWDVVGRLPVRDVLLGVAPLSRYFHTLLCGATPSWTSDEFWRLYALRWHLEEPLHSLTEMPTCWRTFCRAGLECWRFASDTTLHVGMSAPEAAVLVCETDEEEVEAQAGHKILVLDKQRRMAALEMPLHSWSATIVLVDRPITQSKASIRFRVDRQEGFWMVGVASPLSVERRSGPSTTYGATWDLRLSYNTTGVVHVPSSDPLVPVSDMGTTGARAMDFTDGQEVAVVVVNGTAFFFVDNTLRYRPFDLSRLVRPWHFFWGTDGAGSAVAILPPTASQHQCSDQ